MGLRGLEKDYDKSEDDIKALQSVGQIIGELLKQLDDERCGPSTRSEISVGRLTDFLVKQTL